MPRLVSTSRHGHLPQIAGHPLVSLIVFPCPLIAFVSGRLKAECHLTRAVPTAMIAALIDASRAKAAETDV